MAYLNCKWKLYTPEITLVGGAGNTVPQYSTVLGQYFIHQKKIDISILFSGDDGNEGAGSGQINVSLPVPIGANVIGNGHGPIGYAQNDGNIWMIGATINADSSTIPLNYWSAISTYGTLTGDQQNNAVRLISLNFCYRLD